MHRGAILASVALHFGLVCLIGWRWSSEGGRTGSGQTAAAASFSADAVAGSFFSDAGAAPPPEPGSKPRFPESAFTPPEPAGGILASPISVWAANPALAIVAPPAIPMANPNLSVVKMGKAKHPVRARSGGNPAAQGGSGAKGDGNGHGNAGYVPPQFRLRYKPPYPEEARALRLEGTVLLLVSIDVAGHVTSANVLCGCGHAVLDRAALAAVRAWRFDPARQDGVAIGAQVEVPVRFCFAERSTA